MNYPSLLTAATAALMLLACISYTPDRGPESTPADAVDRVIGDGGFNRLNPIVPGNGVDQDLQVTRRLTAIEELLRRRDVTAWPEELRAERARNIDRLHEYRLRASYPRNYDHPEQMLPCFIDREGTICAVGYLVEQSAGRDVAERINARYQYATVAAMNDPAVDSWIARSGLTRAEVETIQEPGFAGSSGISRTDPRLVASLNAGVLQRADTTRPSISQKSSQQSQHQTPSPTPAGQSATRTGQ